MHLYFQTFSFRVVYFKESYVHFYGSYFETSVRKLYCLTDQVDARGQEQEAGRAAANR